MDPRRTALITGPTAGIGAAFARALAASGHDVVLVARDGGRLTALADSLATAHGVGTEVIVADLSQPDGLAAVAARLADRDRPIDVLVNNAGFGVKSSFGRSDVEDEQRMLTVLVTAVMRLTHAAIPPMLERGSGSVINVSSVAGWITGGTYSAAKAWVTVFSESLSAEFAGSGVRVTAACPGFVHTEFHERADMDMSSVPTWMWLEADAVARQALGDSERGRALSVTGLQYKAFSALLRHAPRVIVRRVGAARSTSGRFARR
ncbi:MAG: SDR family NAD(P)-dependent oxidoreductase [Actinobacteria bacterium]|uniref:Unannotated protein n=1 Tax=freshwater metagenome TaxID=449393 RepID=A0A6J7EXB0_9ZZZZ|nr:SDR family NAD(P)-dependent oxidoreductase [Actinomycetota bacterium]